MKYPGHAEGRERHPYDCFRSPIRWAHGVLAVLGVSVCALLVLSGGGGHPPPIVLVPVVVPVWVLGHLALWIIRRLLIRGRESARRSGSGSLPWPPGLVAAGLGTGAVFLMGSAQLAISAVLLRPYPYRGLMWIVMVVVWAFHSVCFFGLLRRRAWSRLLLAGLCSAWALYRVWQVVERYVRGVRISPLKLLVALTLVGLFTLFGYHFISSRRVREFLSIAGDSQA